MLTHWAKLRCHSCLSRATASASSQMWPDHCRSFLTVPFQCVLDHPGPLRHHRTSQWMQSLLKSTNDHSKCYRRLTCSLLCAIQQRSLHLPSCRPELCPLCCGPWKLSATGPTLFQSVSKTRHISSRQFLRYCRYHSITHILQLQLPRNYH